MTKIKVIMREDHEGNVKVEIEPLLQYGSTKEKRACAAILIKITDCIKMLEGKQTDNEIFNATELLQDINIKSKN